MKTNVSINLNDTERRLLADFIDCRSTKRLATRAEIVALARASIERVLIAETIRNGDDLMPDPSPFANNPMALHEGNYPPSVKSENIYAARIKQAEDLKAGLVNMAETPDPEDADHLADKSTGHVRGWNQVKNHEAEVKRRAMRLFISGT